MNKEHRNTIVSSVKYGYPERVELRLPWVFEGERSRLIRKLSDGPKIEGLEALKPSN